MWSDGYCTRVQWTGTPKYVCVAQGLMREVVAVLPPPPPLCIHFSCVHYITIIIIFPYNSTIVIQESTGRDEVREYKEPSAYTL